MKIAIEGCAHGELERIYDVIQYIEEKENFKVDLLICCGDFESTRNMNDLQCMAVPQKYQEIGTFYKYFSGEKKAPMLTIFIGGNHEASNYLQELPYGGWVAPNIYYLGYAGVININGLRIGGLSGIYKSGDYNRGRYEYAPFDEQSKRSVYHIRQLEVFRLKQLTPEFDVFLSHDWPVGVYNFGDYQQLIKFKPHFKQEIERNELGSKPAGDLLGILKPKYWFSAHLHCKFAALIPHSSDGDCPNSEQDNIQQTKFLALDKCLPKRRFLQVIDVDVPEEFNDKPPVLNYDLEWLTILHLTNHLLNVKHTNGYMPDSSSEERYNFRPTEEEKQIILEKFNNVLEIPNNFVKTAAPHDGNTSNRFGCQPLSIINPQTTALCNTLCIDDPLSIAMLMSGHKLNHYNEKDEESSKPPPAPELKNIPPPRSLLSSSLPKPLFVIDTNPDEMNLDDEDQVTLKSEETKEADTMANEEDKIIENISKDEEQPTNPLVKKFKRRNQAIYNATEETD